MGEYSGLPSLSHTNDLGRHLGDALVGGEQLLEFNLLLGSQLFNSCSDSLADNS